MPMHPMTVMTVMTVMTMMTVWQLQMPLPMTLRLRD
jgi:hypothetical protein